eukprot:1686967-Alexandrium_andersonii.AAC.1
MTGLGQFLRPRQPSWNGLQVDAGMSLADTAAQNGVVGLRSFRQLEAKLHELGLKPVVADHKASAVGVGGKA